MILTDTDLVGSARHWDLDYLSQHMGDGMFTVYKSDNHKFKYYSDKKAMSLNEFQPPTRQVEITFRDFVQLIKSKDKNSTER